MNIKVYRGLLLTLPFFICAGITTRVAGQEINLRSVDTVISFSGENPNDQFGIAVASGGDVNGDGYPDIAIGARFYPSTDTGAVANGRAYIYFGGPSLDTIPDVIITGENQDDWFGQSVALVKDVNGDGIDDIFIGAPYNDRNGSAAGSAYLFEGSTTWNSLPHPIYLSASSAYRIFSGESTNDNFGYSVAGIGKFAEQSYNDLAVGARFNSRAGFQHGATFVYQGGPSISTTPTVIFTGEQSNDWFGNAIAGVGDVNKDGYSDLVIGAPYWSKSFLSLDTEIGRAYLFTGSSTRSGTIPATSANAVFTGQSGNDHFGISLAGAGDMNGDGYSDIIIGAPSDGFVALKPGYADIYLGSNSISSTPDLVLSGSTVDGWFGAAVASAGHYSNSTFTDVIIGSIYNSQNGYGAGKAQVFYGGNSMDTISDAYLVGENPNDNLGDAVAPAENILGNGKNGMLIGAYYWDPTGSSIAYGRVYLVIPTGVTYVTNWELYQ